MIVIIFVLNVHFFLVWFFGIARSFCKYKIVNELTKFVAIFIIPKKVLLEEMEFRQGHHTTNMSQQFQSDKDNPGYHSE